MCIYLGRHTRRQHKGIRQAKKLYRPELPSIEDRSKVVERREKLGHWEDDCIASRESTARLKTMNESDEIPITPVRIHAIIK